MKIVVRCFDSTKFVDEFVHIVNVGSDADCCVTLNNLSRFICGVLVRDLPVSDDEDDPSTHSPQLIKSIGKAFKLFSFNDSTTLMVDKFVGTFWFTTQLSALRQLKEDERDQDVRVYFDILPKCYRNEPWHEVTVERLTQMASAVPKMLNRINDSRHGSKNYQGLIQDINTPLLGFFLESFFTSVDKIIEDGLLRRYVQRESNEKFLKGRLLVSDNIRHNAFRQDRFVSRYQELSEDIPENRLISAALLIAQNLVLGNELANKLDTALNAFAFIEPSTDYIGDFERVSDLEPELPSDYRNALWWSRLILNHEGLAMAQGSSRDVQSLFIDMNNLFERYIKVVLQERLKQSEKHGRRDLIAQNQVTFGRWQNNGYSETQLAEVDAFKLKPDYVVKSDDQYKLVLDAKWKLFDGNDNDISIDKISIADARQFYAYQSYFNPKEKVAVLICPQTAKLNRWGICKFQLAEFNEQTRDYALVVIPYDLEKEEFVQGPNTGLNVLADSIHETINNYFNLA